MLENSGIRRQQLLGALDGAAISGGILLALGSGLVMVLLGWVAGNNGTCASLLQARLLTWCGLLVMCPRLGLRIMIIRLLSASRRLSLTLHLVL